MNARMITAGAVVLGMAIATTFSIQSALWAQHEEHHGMAAVAETKAGASGESGMPMMHMKMMAKMKALLEEAKGAAEAEKAKATEAKVDEALKMIEQAHQQMHQNMAAMQEKMMKRMAAMAEMEQECKKMKEEMGKKEEAKPMQSKMEEMEKKMKQMKEDTQKEGMAGKEGKMMCPMCGKMMADAKPKVINTVCPIMGGKVDPNNVPDNLTREFEGKKIGFCCPMCPPKWDKLSDQEKKARLEEVMKMEKEQGQEKKPMMMQHAR